MIPAVTSRPWQLVERAHGANTSKKVNDCQGARCSRYQPQQDALRVLSFALISQPNLESLVRNPITTHSVTSDDDYR